MQRRMLSRIVTHPGGAHKDDLLVACVLVAKHPVPVFRREPTAEDLADPTVAVLDVGGQHDPERMNFDHHHFPREHAPTCCLSLVLAHEGLYEDALRFCDWLPAAEWFDSRGPVATAQWLEVPRRAVSQLFSPIDGTLLRRFAGADVHAPGETIYEMMRLVGEDLLTYLRDARARLDFVAEHARRWTVEREGEALEIVFMPRTEPLASEPSSALASYVRAQELDQTVHALVYPDRRGTGYGLQRYEDCAALDFSRVEGEPDVHFAHKRGFMCKTSALDEARLQDILRAAWR